MMTGLTLQMSKIRAIGEGEKEVQDCGVNRETGLIQEI